MSRKLIFLVLVFGLISMMTVGQIEKVQELVQKADEFYNERFNLSDTGHFLAELGDYRNSLEKAAENYEEAWELRIDLNVQSQAYVADRLAQVEYELTTYLPVTAEEQIEELLWKGKEYGFESLGLNPEFNEERFSQTLQYIQDVAALLWTADCWGTWLGYHPMQGMVNIGKVKDMYERAIEIDEDYWGGSPHNALGALLVTTPSFLGGSVEEGREHLEKALEIAPDYLVNHVVFAEYWGFTYDLFGNKSGIRNKHLIERELNFVLSSPIGDKWPFWNREAKKEAQSLLEELERISANG